MPVGGCPILTERALYSLDIWIAEPRLSNSIERLKEGRNSDRRLSAARAGEMPNIVAPRTARRLEIRKPSKRRYPDFLNWGRQTWDWERAKSESFRNRYEDPTLRSQKRCGRRLVAD